MSKLYLFIPLNPVENTYHLNFPFRWWEKKMMTTSPVTPKSSGRKHNIIKGRSELKETVLFINPVIIAHVYKFSKNTTMGMHCNPGLIKDLKETWAREELEASALSPSKC